MNRMLALPMLCAIAAAAALNGCASPSITVTSPETGTVVTATGTVNGEVVPVSFTVSVLTLAERGSCGSQSMCGHVRITVDGVGCNGPGTDYNVEGAALTLNANLSYCPVITGMHTIRLEVLKDDDSPFNPAVTAMTTVTVNPYGPGTFAGTYNLTGSSVLTIVSPPGFPNQTSAANGAMTITPGTRTSAVMDFGACRFNANRVNDTLTLTPGQTCAYSSGLNSGTLVYSMGTALLNGTQITIQANGTAAGTLAGNQYTATFVYASAGPRQ